jgi:hypothetical protein
LFGGVLSAAETAL